MRKYKILCIDGGGIRGIIPGQVIAEIEKRFGIIVADYFDMVAGTSTGGILTCAHLIPDDQNPTRPKFKAQEVVDLYLKNGERIFNIPFGHRLRSLFGVIQSKYPHDGIEAVMNEYFGEKKLSDLLKPCLVASYDLINQKAHFFRQQRAKLDPEHDFKVREVARSTSAAPTYFEVSNVKSLKQEEFTLVDGGVYANNPALCAYAEARNIFEKPSGEGAATAIDMQILSISTGHSKDDYTYKKARKWGAAEWVMPVIDIMMSGVSQTVHYQLTEIFKSVNAELQYLRIDEEIKKPMSSSMDKADSDHLIALQEFGKNVFQKSEEKLAAFFEA